jgi:RsiW-degrading membrane proteinase PrsW (M82 family)
MALFISILLGFIPMLFFAGFVNWLDRYEKEPKLLLGGVFSWGAIIAAGAAFLFNTLLGSGIYLFTNSESFSTLTTGVFVAPLVEETLKGLAVLIVYLAFMHEFDSILDGIIYAAITALGFAATENIFYIYELGYVNGGYEGLFTMAFVRIVLVGWQHPFYTSFIGIGLAITRLNKPPLLRVAAPLFGWSLAVFTHAVHNTLAQTLEGPIRLLVGTSIDWIGWISIFIVVILAIRNDQRTLQTQLTEEVHLGTITTAQYQTACSAWAQTRARLESLFSSSYRYTNRFYQVAAELAHKKHQRTRMGEEQGNSLRIYQLQAELARLSPLAQA